MPAVQYMFLTNYHNVLASLGEMLLVDFPVACVATAPLINIVAAVKVRQLPLELLLKPQISVKGELSPKLSVANMIELLLKSFWCVTRLQYSRAPKNVGSSIVAW